MNPDQQKLARIAAALYLLLIPLGVFGILYMPEFIWVEGDNAATLANITANTTAIRLSILTAFAIQITQLFLVVALFYLLRPFGKTAAWFMVLFTLATMPIAMLNELCRVAGLMLLNSETLSAVFNPEQLQAAALFAFELHADGIMIAHVFWGLWLMPMGWLVARSSFLPSMVGWLLIIGGIGYALDTITWFWLGTDRYMIAHYTFIGEVLLPLALLYRSVKPASMPNAAEPTTN
ncbi:hypothetical protein BGP77_07310 [Saccharospirillum sp. MSK14-1]|uniref:DUF4386 domain-containing protein n=1 Tax=Saccharospirillum sp. MSK14-1 TaxID=1897632 RepID=UPI000D37F4BC|nr:DUF4386 domain-containing protein [Saccharospirillum sp. MSK14-1]PTY37080.1 hypothetical protein BGP77_07310 [Saccharospirillum sp. MSK14-1]